MASNTSDNQFNQQQRPVITPQALFTTSIPKLKGQKNYDDWAFQIKLSLRHEQLTGWLKDTRTLEQIQANPTECAKHERCHITLLSTLSSEVVDTLHNTGWDEDQATAAETWAKLRATVLQISQDSLSDLIRSFYTIERENFPTLREYIHKLQWISQHIEKSGEPIGKITFITIALEGLRDSDPHIYLPLKHDLDSGRPMTKEGFLEFMQKKAVAETLFAGQSIAVPTTKKNPATTSNNDDNNPYNVPEEDICKPCRKSYPSRRVHRTTRCWITHPHQVPDDLAEGFFRAHPELASKASEAGRAHPHVGEAGKRPSLQDGKETAQAAVEEVIEPKDGLRWIYA